MGQKIVLVILTRFTYDSPKAEVAQLQQIGLVQHISCCQPALQRAVHFRLSSGYDNRNVYGHKLGKMLAIECHPFKQKCTIKKGDVVRVFLTLDFKCLS